jgi:hypothetical protein
MPVSYEIGFSNSGFVVADAVTMRYKKPLKPRQAKEKVQWKALRMAVSSS